MGDAPLSPYDRDVMQLQRGNQLPQCCPSGADSLALSHIQIGTGQEVKRRIVIERSGRLVFGKARQ